MVRVPFGRARTSAQSTCTDAAGEFSNPSGHAITCIAPSLIMWLDYNASVKQSESGFGSHLCRFSLLAVAIVIALPFGYLRVLLGMHSMDQILFGWLLGVWFAFTFHLCARTALTQSA